MKIPVSGTAVLLLAFAVPHRVKAYDIEFPQMKEGLWSIHQVTTTNPGNKTMDATETLCRNHAYDEYAHSLSKGRAGCTVIKEEGGNGAWTLESECKVQASVMHVKANIKSIDANTAHSETHSTMTPPMMGISETTMIQDQKFVGACPAGQAPGDMVMGNGMVMHLWKK